MIGNVTECCAWTGTEAGAPLADPDVGMRIDADPAMVTFRGGSAVEQPMDAKPAGPRLSLSDTSETLMGGVRPARTVR